MPETIGINFQTSGDTDLYYGIGKCEIKCAYTKSPSSIRIKFTIDDKYNFDEIRTIQRDVEQSVVFEFGLGNLANDLGLLSQVTDVISVYHVYVSFEKTINLR